MVPKKLRALKVLGLCSILISCLIAGALAYYIEGFESGSITDFWVIDKKGSGSVKVSSGAAAKYGSYGLNATGYGIATENYAFIWTDNMTTGPADYNYMGYWFKIDSSYVLMNTKKSYISALWNENYTTCYVHFKNDSGSLRWYPNGGPVCGPTIYVNVWYWVVQGYYINHTGGPGGYYATWVNEAVIQNVTADTSYWGWSQGISVGSMGVYDLAGKGGTLYFDHVCHDSSMLSSSEDELIPWGTWPVVVGFMGMLFLIAGPMYVVYEAKKGPNNFPDAFAWGMMCIFIGIGLVVVWLGK